MVLTVEWRNDNTVLPKHSLMLIAFPGVGNVGKAAIDAVNSVNGATQIARLHDTSLPPLACLDEDGLLAPPHYTISSIESTTGKIVLTLTGSTQPVDPNSQGMLANEIMQFFMQQGMRIRSQVGGVNFVWLSQQEFQTIAEPKRIWEGSNQPPIRL